MAQQNLKTLTNSVSETMMTKLYQNGQLNNSHTMGIDPKSTALAMAIARLYSANNDGQFQSMRLAGILCLVADRRLHSKYFRLYDINSNELLFQSELYINFQNSYRELNDYFFCFPLEKITIGVQFANVHDASIFKNLVQTYSFKGENVDDLMKQQYHRLGKHDYEISRPLGFERKEHAGWDPVSQTFILNEIPKEIKGLLKKAGFKKKDLKTKETALAIYEILLREIEFDTLNSKSLNSLIMTTGRSSSNLNSKDFILNRISAGRPVSTNNEESRIMDNRSYSINIGGFQSQNTLALQNIATNQDHLDPSQSKGKIMGTIGSFMMSHMRNNSATMKLEGSPSQKGLGMNSQLLEEQKTGMSGMPQMKPPPIPPPLMGIIPPPPMNMPPPVVGFMPPPPIGGGSKLVPPPMNIQPPPIMIQQSTLSFTEQLVLQSQNLKKVAQETQINNKVKNLSETQQMKIAMNLAVVLEQRKKALMNDDKANNSNVDSDEEDDDSDGSAW